MPNPVHTSIGLPFARHSSHKHAVSSGVVVTHSQSRPNTSMHIRRVLPLSTHASHPHPGVAQSQSRPNTLLHISSVLPFSRHLAQPHSGVGASSGVVALSSPHPVRTVAATAATATTTAAVIILFAIL